MAHFLGGPLTWADELAGLLALCALGSKLGEWAIDESVYTKKSLMAHKNGPLRKRFTFYKKADSQI